MRRLILPFFLLFYGCVDTNQNQTADQGKYFFDLKGYFQKEAVRLSAQKRPVLKEVIRNNSKERRELLINWNRELELFSESDINKAAWKDSYRRVDSGHVVAYVATDDELRTKKILLEKGPDGKLKHIEINNHTSNFLYSSTEKLSYYPDKGYTIEKTQQIRVIGRNHYTINASLK